LWIWGVDDSLFWGAMILKVDAMHLLVKTLCTCSCGMVLMMHVGMTRLLIWWVVIARAIIGRERMCVASRFPTIKIPSVLLVAVMWLQHTRCPRFRRGTIGYGTATSPKGEIGYEYGVFMWMQVSMPKVPKCICYEMHAQKWHNFNSKSREQDQKE
jgi:hypothetical protein